MKSERLAVVRCNKSKTITTSWPIDKIPFNAVKIPIGCAVNEIIGPSKKKSTQMEKNAIEG